MSRLNIRLLVVLIEWGRRRLFLSIVLSQTRQLSKRWLNYKVKNHGRLFQTANLSYFYHNYLNQGIGITTELGYEYRFTFGLAFEGLLGIGYLHTFATTEEFVLKNGQYEKEPDIGNSRLYPTLSLDVGYYFRPSDKTSPKIFLRYQSWAEYPYSPGFIPLMTHINLHLGVKFFLKYKIHSNE
jgi:hypothetical protein